MHAIERPHLPRVGFMALGAVLVAIIVLLLAASRVAEGIAANSASNATGAPTSQTAAVHGLGLTKALGTKPATKKIWIPDALFANQHNLLSGLVFGDGMFVNAYQIGVTAFGNAGKGQYVRYAAEIMGIESVHRALALQSLGKPGNDQAFASGSTRYFTDINKAVSLLQSAGFGFGAKGKGPGKFYEFDQVTKHTQHRREVHQLSPH